MARALVCGALERLRADGCDFLFVVADDTDTVKDLYRRLGFDERPAHVELLVAGALSKTPSRMLLSTVAVGKRSGFPWIVLGGGRAGPPAAVRRW